MAKISLQKNTTVKARNFFLTLKMKSVAKIKYIYTSNMMIYEQYSKKCKFVLNMYNISWLAYLKPLSARRLGYIWQIFKFEVKVVLFYLNRTRRVVCLNFNTLP